MDIPRYTKIFSVHKTHSFSYLLICIKLNVPRIDTKIIIWIPTYNVYNWWWMPIVDPFWTSYMLILALQLTIESLWTSLHVSNPHDFPWWNPKSFGSLYKSSFYWIKAQFLAIFWINVELVQSLDQIPIRLSFVGSSSIFLTICLWRTSHFAMLFQGTGTRFGCPRTLPWHCLCERLQPLRNWAERGTRTRSALFGGNNIFNQLDG